jgi:SAM-dependent MidA family methyltransferase
LFGAVLARAIDDVWKQCGEPDNFTIVEVGAGPGTLARSILAAEPRCLQNGTYIAVEVSETQRQSHPDGVVSVSDMPDRVDNGVIIANELLDNLPFDVWVYDNGWRQAHVIDTPQGFSEVLRNAEVPSVLPSRVKHGSRAPIHTHAVTWLQKALQTLSRGSIMCIDYCTPTTAEVASMPWREWLRTYTQHQRGTHYLRDVGDQDITTQVCIDQLVRVREPDSVRSQSQFLQLWGMTEMVDEGKRVWEESASAPTLAAIKMRSRISESEALLDMSGLGSFTVLEWKL